MNKHRTVNRRRGDYGERRTLWYLRFRGFHLLERNFCYGHKEIDLIMQKGNLIAFVEVKSRTDTSRVRPQTAVTLKKQFNIITAAKAYVQRNGYSDRILRFDVSEVELSSGKITYIPNAFTA